MKRMTINVIDYQRRFKIYRINTSYLNFANSMPRGVNGDWTYGPLYCQQSNGIRCQRVCTSESYSKLFARRHIKAFLQMIRNKARLSKNQLMHKNQQSPLWLINIFINHNKINTPNNSVAMQEVKETVNVARIDQKQNQRGLTDTTRVRCESHSSSSSRLKSQPNPFFRSEMWNTKLSLINGIDCIKRRAS